MPTQVVTTFALFAWCAGCTVQVAAPVGILPPNPKKQYHQLQKIANQQRKSVPERTFEKEK